MRQEEIFALNSLTSVFGGEYRNGEDPPDAYINLSGKCIAVEVTMLVEQITRNGKTHPRLADEMPVRNISTEMEEKIGIYVPDNSWLYLGLPSPIENIGEFKDKLVQVILEFLENDLKATEKMILGNLVSLNLIRAKIPPERKVVQFVSSRQSFCTEQAELILRERIEAKKIKTVQLDVNEYWLVLINTYWPASIETYREIYNRLKVEHKFDKIYIIDHGGNVDSLY